MITPLESVPRRPLVLLVDDDDTTRMWAEVHLGHAGFDFLEARDGVEALELLEHRRPDVTLLDVDMPRLGGFATCERIRTQKELVHMPVLMVTGYDDTTSIERAFAAGATDFATKPINWTLLCHRLRYIIRARDILIERDAALRELEDSRAMLNEAQRIADLGSWELQVDSAEVAWSKGIYSVLGIGGPLQPRITPFLEYVAEPDRNRFRKVLGKAVEVPGGYALKHGIIRSDGRARIVHHRLESIADSSGAVARVRATIQDVTQRERSEERIRKLAYFDSLTGLPNRASFRDRLDQEIKRVLRRGGHLAILFLDLDDFKRINDTLGHDAGDKLLAEVAVRLVASVRGSDVVTRQEADGNEDTVARLGGDEFILLLTDLNDPEDAAVVAERILKSLRRPVRIVGHDVIATPSIGISLFPQNGDDADTLLKNADTAMYCSKSQGKNLFRFYDKGMNAAALRRLEIEAALRTALKRNELAVHYQPQMDLSVDIIDGVEALLRWTSPELGNVPPAEFIPLAEKTGLIVPIGEWVLRNACAQLKKWQEHEIGLKRVAVNVSLRQLVYSEFVETVACILQETGLSPSSLEIEITESLLAKNVEGVLSTLKGLKEIGVQLAIDDFGTGYSSLAHLKRFPVDRLKIDRSFVREITTDQDDAAIVTAVIGMADSMRLSVTAEGVETKYQLEFLRERSCEQVQGYYLSRPLPPRELATLLWRRQSNRQSVRNEAPSAELPIPIGSSNDQTTCGGA